MYTAIDRKSFSFKAGTSIIWTIGGRKEGRLRFRFRFRFRVRVRVRVRFRVRVRVRVITKRS